MRVMGLAFPKPEPRAVTKHTKRKEADQALRDAYADVDARDAGFCWITGRYTQSGAVDARVRREHHHLIPRSRSKALRAMASNIITVCAEAHQLITAGHLVVEGADARRPLFFHWSPSVENPPFRIKPKKQGNG